MELTIKILVLMTSIATTCAFGDDLSRVARNSRVIFRPKNFLDLQQLKRTSSNAGQMNSDNNPLALVDPSLSRLMKRESYDDDLMIDPSINRLIKRGNEDFLVDPSLSRLLKRFTSNPINRPVGETPFDRLMEMCQEKLIPMATCLHTRLYLKV